MSWKKVDIHRRRARQIPLNILVWGPSHKDRKGYALRMNIRNYLNKNGHSAKFSEELFKEGNIKAATDPLIDEIFHADAANLIVVLYGSKGTQTEFDKILGYEKFAHETVQTASNGKQGYL